MPDCARCEIIEQVRQHRVNAETAVGLLQMDLEAVQACRPRWWCRRLRVWRDARLTSIGMALSRACHQRDYCDRLLVGLEPCALAP